MSIINVTPLRRIYQSFIIDYPSQLVLGVFSVDKYYIVDEDCACNLYLIFFKLFFIASGFLFCFEFLHFGLA